MNVKIAANVISCCSSSSISILMPSAVNGTKYTIQFNGPLNQVKFNYTALTSNTASVQLTSPSTVSVGSNTITLNQIDTVSNPITSIKLISTKDSLNIISVATWSTLNKVTTFTASLTSGSFSI